MFNKFSTTKYRWVALVFLSLSLAIVIIDNSVLNVAIPYILHDLNTSLNNIQWVISGYALIIATLLITVSRLGDMYGRKRILMLGTVLFAIGSFTASIAPNVFILFIGEAFIEAIGAAMMLTSSLALLTNEFRGKERALAFGVWGAVAGAAGSIGPLVGGYFTTYYSWRWSLRINVVVALIALAGSIFIIAPPRIPKLKLDVGGAILSGLGLFAIVFGFIEGQKYGWWHINQTFKLGALSLPGSISIIPYAFILGAVLLIAFVYYELYVERKGGKPLLQMRLFKNRGFSAGLITLGIVSLGQFGTFFIMPIYLQNVLGKNAFQTGLVFLSSSLTILIIGPLTGLIVSRKVRPRIIVSLGMFCVAGGIFWLSRVIGLEISIWTLTPPLILFGIGVGSSSAQLTNVVLSAVPQKDSGEASAANNTMRQVGTSIGIAVIGVIFASTVASHIVSTVNQDTTITAKAKTSIIQSSQLIGSEVAEQRTQTYSKTELSIKPVIDKSLVQGSKEALVAATGFVILGAIASLFIPSRNKEMPI